MIALYALQILEGLQEYCEYFYTNKADDLHEMNKFL